MIPVRLVIKDFLSYADPEPLDFTTFHVACLSGSNGVGKSALLDAITWSVWARARGCESGQNQERLIRDGADEMTVDFTFDLGTSRYRIVRRRPRTGTTDVQFLVRDGDSWKNIAAETTRETDAKIESVLRMDYRTFTASAFFLQGRSDDFLTRMKPDERKDVFGRLLDLGIYEKLEDAARERARDADRSRKEIEQRIERLSEGAPDVAAIEADLKELEASLRTIDERTTAAIAGHKAARETLGSLQAVAERLKAGQDARTAAERALEGARRDEATKRETLVQIDKLLRRAGEVTAAIEEAAALARDEAAAQDAQTRAAVLDARIAELRASIEGERRTIGERATNARAQIAKLEAELGALQDASKELIAADAALEGTAEIGDALGDARKLAGSLAEDGARLKEQITQLETLATKTRRNLEVLADGAKGAGECPVCGSALDAKHRAKVKRDIEKELAAADRSREAATADLEVARKEAVRCREEIKRLERAQAERDQLVTKRQGLIGRLERSALATAERTSIADALAADAVLLRDETFAVESRAALIDVEKEREGLYDAAAHMKIRARLDELAPYAELAGRIEEATKSRERVVADIDTAIARGAELIETIAGQTTAIDELTTQLAGLPDAQRTFEECEALVEHLRQLAADAAAEQGRLQERRVAARKTHADLEQARSEERAAADAHRRYRRLVETFGPAGIPKLIIDNALPELTDDANRILGRLSDHEMSVQFRLERETKAGKPKETFEVLVAHDGGVRDFAMFSGGEAFRVAFAVRLAMSKLLVRRAGARLETLVIDEGFGSQDPEGRERLVEAINLARDGFAKVLVITHLDDLKDQFGTQIRVDKTDRGSSLEIVGS